MSFAVSMTDPPPTARKASAWYGFANSIASFILRQVSPHRPYPADLRGDSRAILRLHSRPIKHLIRNALPLQALTDLLHGIQLRDRLVRHDHDLFSAHVLEVHADFLGAAGAEADGAGSHLERVLLLLRGIERGGEAAATIVPRAVLLRRRQQLVCR